MLVCLYVCREGVFGFRVTVIMTIKECNIPSYASRYHGMESIYGKILLRMGVVCIYIYISRVLKSWPESTYPPKSTLDLYALSPTY